MATEDLDPDKVIHGDNEVPGKAVKVRVSGHKLDIDTMEISWGKPLTQEDIIEEIRGKLKNVMSDEEIDELDGLLDDLEDKLGEDDDSIGFYEPPKTPNPKLDSNSKK